MHAAASTPASTLSTEDNDGKKMTAVVLIHSLYPNSPSCRNYCCGKSGCELLDTIPMQLRIHVGGDWYSAEFPTWGTAEHQVQLPHSLTTAALEPALGYVGSMA